MGPIGKPPCRDEGQTLVVVDDLVEAAAVVIDQRLRGAERGLSERQGARSVAIEPADADEHDRQPPKLGEPAGLAGNDPAHQLVRQERRQEFVTGQLARSSGGVGICRLVHGPGRRPDLGDDQVTRVAFDRGPMQPARGGCAGGQHQLTRTCQRRRRRGATHGRSADDPAPFVADPADDPDPQVPDGDPGPGTNPDRLDRRASLEQTLAFQRAGGGRDHRTGQVVGGSWPDRMDRVARETDDVAALSPDPLDDVAEGFVEDRSERLSAAGTALRETLSEGREPDDVDHQDDPGGPPDVGRGHIPSGARETLGQDRGDERSEGRLRHPREDTRVCDTPGHGRFAGGRSP